MFYVLKRKNQCKIRRFEKEKLLPEYLQQTNTEDGGNVGIWGGTLAFGTTPAKIHTKNMNGNVYCNVLHHQIKPSMAKLPKNVRFFFQQDLAP